MPDRVVLLDSGPIGLACCDPSQRVASHCLSWLIDLEMARVKIMIPAIMDYEVRRELLRARASAKLIRLEELRVRFDLLDIRIEALERAAGFGAKLRQTGLPTAGDEAIDADAILAGMAITIGQPGDSVVIATTNVKHLVRFPGIDARLWDAIV